MSLPSLRPVETLHASLDTLESLLAGCLASPDVRAVHRLRTQTRRVESMLSLLPLVPGLSHPGKHSAAVARLLRRTRRAAGKVRDLDVHRDMLKGFAAQEEAFAQGGAPAAAQAPVLAPRKAKPKQLGRSSAFPTPSPDGDRLLSQAATELQHHMGAQRESMAAELRHTLQDMQRQLSQAAEALLGKLAATRDASLSVTDLQQHAEGVALRSNLMREGKPRKFSEDELHSLRKDAKAGRYVAESLPGEPTLARTAERLEALQHLGGEWHDALEIARAARDHFGKSHPLTTAFRAQRDLALAAYREALTAAQAIGQKPAPRRKRRNASPEVGVDSPAAAQQ